MVSVVQREWAAKNPRATFKTPITVEDVLNSRMIAYPFRLLQCCLVTDGGGALILVAAERAATSAELAPGSEQGPVYLLGTGESVEIAEGQPARHSRESGNPRGRTYRFVCSWTPASAGVTIINCRAARLEPSSPRAIPPPAASCRSIPMAEFFLHA